MSFHFCLLERKTAPHSFDALLAYAYRPGYCCSSEEGFRGRSIRLMSGVFFPFCLFVFFNTNSLIQQKSVQWYYEACLFVCLLASCVCDHLAHLRAFTHSSLNLVGVFPLMSNHQLTISEGGNWPTGVLTAECAHFPMLSRVKGHPAATAAVVTTPRTQGLSCVAACIAACIAACMRLKQERQRGAMCVFGRVCVWMWHNNE